MEYRVEYLLIVEKGHTRSVDSLRKLLEADDEIHLTEEQLHWQGQVFAYQLSQGTVQNQQQGTYFYLTLVCEAEAIMEHFIKALKRVRGQLSLLGTQVFTLWDDVSRYYSAQAYHQIHYLENLMRKLLTKFMLINVGLEWNKSHAPEEVGRSIKQQNRDINYFNNVDFIKLSDFLFSENYPAQRQEVLEKLQHTAATELRPDELKALLPQSNWSKYFAQLMECDGPYLERRWRKLYDLRNAIAHNKQFSKNDAQEVARLSGEVGHYLEEALSQLDEIMVTEAEKATVLEEVASGKNRKVGSFIRRYRRLEHQLQALYRQHRTDPPPALPALIQTLAQQQVLKEDLAEQLMEVTQLHQQFIHSESVNLPIQDWRDYARGLEDYLDQIQQLLHYDETSHTGSIQSADVLTLYQTLKQQLLALPEVGIRYNKHYISFLYQRHLVDLRLQQNAIKVWLNANWGQLADAQGLARNVSAVGHLGNGDYEMRLTHADQLEPLLDLVQQVYNLQQNTAAS